MKMKINLSKEEQEGILSFLLVGTMLFCIYVLIYIFH